jgi:hypothetical protein
LQIRIDVRDILIRDDFASVGRHLAGGLTDVGYYRLQGKWRRGDANSVGASLADIAVAFIASVTSEDFFAVLGIPGERDRRLRRGSHGFQVGVEVTHFLI